MSSFHNNSNNNCKQLYRKAQQPSQQYQGQPQISRTQELERQLKNCQLSKIEQAEIYNSLGNEYYSQTQYWKAINAHTRALKLTVHSGKECRVIAFRCLGESYRQLKKYKKGLLYCQQHLEMAQQQHHELEIQRALCNMGLLYTDSAEDILLENKNVSEQFEITINLAIDNLLKSQNQVNKVIGIKKQLSFGQLSAGAANNYNYLQDTSLLRLQQIEVDAIYNQANALSIKAKWDNAYYEESIARLKEAASLSNTIKYAILEGKCYNTLGLIYLHQKNYDKSLKCYLKDVEICQREKDVHGVIETYISIGVLFQGKRDYIKSQEYFEKAMSIAKRNKMSESVQKVQESLSNLSAEIALREECNTLEVKIKKSTGRFNEQMCVQYWDALIQLEDFTGLLESINAMSCNSSSNGGNSINLKMMQYKGIAEASLKRFQASRESYEKVLNEQRKQQIISVDFANNLIEYSNVLDELHESTENIERGYLEASEVAVKLQDFYVMKVVLENLDILYESKKLHNRRKEIKKQLNKLLAEHPELKQSSASKDKQRDCSDDEDDDDEGDSSSSDQDSSEDNDGDQFHQRSWGNQQSLQETPLHKNSRTENIYQDEESGNYGNRGDIQPRRVSNKNFLRPAADKNNNIQPRQESRNHNSNNNNNNSLTSEPKTDLFSLVNSGGSKNTASKVNNPNNNPEYLSSLKQPNAKKPIEEAYIAKCKKAIIEPDEQISSMLKQLKIQETNAFHIKNRYFEDDSIGPALKSLKYLQAPVLSLQEFNISHNLLSNQSIGLIISSVVIPSQPSLERLDISYNSFVYDQVFAGFLQHCQSLKRLRYLNISGLLLAEVNQDDCWHQLLLLSSMQTLKFKHSSLNSLPEFLPLSISSSALDSIVLRYNQIHSSNPTNTKVITDILAFRNLQKFDISNQLEIL